MSLVKKKGDMGKGSLPKKRRRQPVKVSSGSSKSDQENGLGEVEGEESLVELFEVDQIVARRPVKGTRDEYEYLIKWVGYRDSDNTWQKAHWLEQYAHWLEDFNRAEDGQIKFRKLKEMVMTMLSGSKAPPAAFAGMDFAGLGVEVPGMDMTMAENEREVKVEHSSTGLEDMADEVDIFQEDSSLMGSSSYPEAAHVTNNGVTMPLEALDPNSHGPEDFIDSDGHANLEVMEWGNEIEMPVAHANPPTSVAMDQNQAALTMAGPSKPGSDPVIVAIGSVPQADLFTTNQKLIKENNLLKSKLKEKEQRIDQLDSQLSELRSIKESRRLFESKLVRKTNELKDALDEVTQLKKDLHSMEGNNACLNEQLKETHCENDELAEMLTERDGRISALEQDQKSRDTHEDQLKEGLFKQQEKIEALERALAKAKQEEQLKDSGIPLGSGHKYDVVQLRGELDEAQYYKSKPDTKVTTPTSEKDTLLNKLAEKSSHVSALEEELKNFRLINQQQKDNLLSKEVMIVSLKREIDAAKKVSKPIPRIQMDSSHNNRLAVLEGAMRSTRFTNSRLNKMIGELRRKMRVIHRNNYSRTMRLRSEHLRLRIALRRKDSLLMDQQEQTRKNASCMASCKEMLAVHKMEHGFPMIDPYSGSGSSDRNKE